MKWKKSELYSVGQFQYDYRRFMNLSKTNPNERPPLVFFLLLLADNSSFS